MDNLSESARPLHVTVRPGGANLLLSANLPGETGGFTVIGGTPGTDYTFAGGLLTIKTGTELEISTGGNAVTDKIFVEKNVSAYITLKDVKIDVSGTASACAFQIADNSTGNVTVTLKGTNELKSGKYYAGLQKNNNTGSGTLEIKGDGSLEATGGDYGAGIGGGGGMDGSGSNITINGTKTVVIAQGGEDAEPIGSGDSAGSTSKDAHRNGGLTIEGNSGKLYGDVTLTQDLKIESGVTVTIGDGQTLTVNKGVTLANNGTITNNGKIINNGTIKGNPVEGSGALTFGGLTVTTISGELAQQDSDGQILLGAGSYTISGEWGGTLRNASFSAPKAAIVVQDGKDAKITLNKVKINVSENFTGAFLIADESTGNVTVTLEGTNELKSGKYCAGLQKNGGTGSGTLEIKGDGSLEATGGDSGASIGGAGIGGGLRESGNNITISGTKTVVIAQGGENGEPIGGVTVTIDDGAKP